MGAASGIWCLDIDTSEDHVDGVAEWEKIAAQHDPIVTREHRSATGGPHLIFNWHAEKLNGCSNGALPDGISVKGEGGYIVVPPSVRKQRSYSVHRDIDPIDASEWLTDLILQGRSSDIGDDNNFSAPPDLDELAEAAPFVPNDDLSWEEWTAYGLALIDATGGSERGFELWDAFSQLSDKYDPHITRQRWREMKGSPGNRTGAGKWFKKARENGWVPGLREGTPTHDAMDGTDVAAARGTVREHADRFWERVDRYHAWIGGLSDEQREMMRGDPSLVPPVEAMRVDTGVGKTEEVIASFAARRGGNSATATRPLIYTVDRHRLSERIDERFAKLGVRARIFRGRGQEDPENPGREMCLNPRAVALAMKTHADINETCCRQGKKRCRFFDDPCGYQGQMQGDPPDVWITAHNMLFHTQKVFGEPAAVIVDEAMWQKGIRGIEREENEIEWAVPIDSLIKEPFNPKVHGYDDDYEERDYWRSLLGYALKKQEKNSGVERKYLEAGFRGNACTQAIRLEWKLMPKFEQHPGMTDAEIRKLASDSDTIDAIQHARRIIRIWETIRELIEDPDITVSGRLTLKQRGGQRIVEWKGVAAISKQFQVPTLLLDATLPALPLLQVYHPQVEIVADIKVAMPPSVRIRQMLRAPTSANKLDNEKHLDDVRRYILQRRIETGRQSTLVICQQKVESYLRSCKLPENVEIAHYNDIAGLDDFKHVRLLILIGRTAPGPRAMETLAAALSGAQPKLAPLGANGFSWYPRTQRGIRLRDGRGIKTTGDQHPDAFVESIRWLVHEGELMQALGRARGINRTSATPLDIDLLFDTCLPITVDEVVRWRTPSTSVEMVRAGVVLTSRADMMRAWPQTWSNDTAARRALEELRKEPNLAALRQIIASWQPVTYQLAGPKMKQRVAYFDLIHIPDPKKWLTKHLGSLKVCINAGPKF
jgi:putative DNA primase/helicase